MTTDSFERSVLEIKSLIEEPAFFEEAFNLVCEKNRKKFASITDNFERIAKDDFLELSREIDRSKIQESFSVRNNLKSRRLAKLLINDKGKINFTIIPKVIALLEANAYSLGPNRQYDAACNLHIIAALKNLRDNRQTVHLLKTISRPHMHQFAEQIIRETLNLSSGDIITDAHAKRAALAALFCFLRQNVGSCFATAPAILVHNEQVNLFLRDIQELLATGRLKRTFGGVEYAVPLSYSWGAGDLRHNFILQKSVHQEDIAIWHSPSLIAALETVGLINRELSLNERVSRAKDLITSTLFNWDSKYEWFTATLEDILKQVILDSLRITKEDIQEWESRPKGMIMGGILMTPPQESKDSQSKEGRCRKFSADFEIVKKVFLTFSDNALLKSWEFTLASFAETKANFTKWNLYASLGINPNDKGGIGPCLYAILQRKLEECNRKAQEYQQDYEAAWSRLQLAQSRARSVSTEKEARWVRSEYQARLNEFRSLEELRDKYHNKARRYANLYDGLIDTYFRLFPNYFQEIYDPDIQETAVGPFDDSPAGFRLLYKYGRTNTSQWSRITNAQEFIDALANFFIASENEIAKAPEMSGLEDDLGEIITAIVSLVRSKEFLESAFYRMAYAHKAPIIENPLENLDKVEKKPWVYTSGGAMNTLVSCYFKLEGKPHEVSRWVESPTELLMFIIDSMKEMPEDILCQFEKNREKSLLMHSPTHAFLLKPGYFAEAWRNKVFTYTWVRDYLVSPMEAFVSKMYLDDEKMQFIFDYLAQCVPVNFRHYFKETFSNIGGSMLVQDLRQHILDTIELTRGLQYASRGVLSQEIIDSALYSLLPIFPHYKLKGRIEAVLRELPGFNKAQIEKILQAFEKISAKAGCPKIISAAHLQNIVKALIALFLRKSSVAFDYPLLISEACQKLGFAMPKPLIFADTNWVKNYFAFLVNPGTFKLELWRVDYTGSSGYPMHDWHKWLNGSRKEPDWGIYNRPHEYVY